MAVPYRLPEPQKSLTSLYSRPNKTGPQQQAVDTGMSEMANALLKAVQPITDYGVIKQNEEKDLIAREESIKIENMAIEEQREYLAKVSREAEESGALATGTNFFRHKFVQEQLAEKLVRNRLSDSLTNQFHRYTDPTENLSGADAHQFALDAYKTIENESITGFYAKSQAQQIYSELSTNWLANVRETRGKRMVAKNKSDVAEFTVAELGRVIDGETDIEAARAAINKVADSLKMVGGGSGREEVAKGMKTLLANAISQAVDARDLVELDALETLYDSLREDEDGNAYTTGVLAFGDEQASIMESIDTLFAQGHARLKTTAREDLTESTRLVSDAADMWFYGKTYAELDNEAEMNQALRTYLESQADADGDLLYTKQAISSFMVQNFGLSIEKAKSSMQADAASTDAAAAVLLEVRAERMGKVVAEAAINSIVNLPNDKKLEALLGIDSIIRANRAVEDNILDTAEASINESESTVDSIITAMIPTLNTEDVFGAGEVGLDLIRWAKDKATQAYNNATGTDDDKTAAAKASYAETSTFMRDMTLSTPYGLDFNLEMVDNSTLPKEIANELAKVSYALAERRLVMDRQPVIASQSPDDPLAGIWGGWAWHSPSFDYSPEIEQYYSKPDRSETDIADINRMISMIRPDAKEQIQSTMRDKMQPDPGDPSTPFPTKEGMILTPKGFLATNPASRESSKYWFGTEPFTDYETHKEQTGNYLQLVRMVGLTPEMMRDGTAYGLDISHFADLRDPARTLLVNGDTFIKDIEALAAANKPEMSQEDLLDKLQGNGIAEGYRAYRDMVGKEDAVGFDYFIKATLNGIGRYSVPYVNEDIRKKLGVPLVAGDDDD